MSTWFREQYNPGKRPRKLRPSTRRWSKERLLEAVKCLVMFGRWEEVIDPYFISGTGGFRGRITAEEYSGLLRAKKPMIEECFHKLNLQGLLTQGSNQPDHDNPRHPRGGGPSSGWLATMYFRRL